MPLEILDVIRTLNLVYENLWMMDFKEALSIIKSKLEREKISDFLGIQEDVKKFLSEIRNMAKEEGIEKSLVKCWAADKLQSFFEKKQINGVTLVIGAMLNRLIHLQEGLSEIVETKVPIRRLENYKYSIIAFPPKFEIRALYNRRIILPEFEALRDKIKKMGFSISVRKTKNAATIHLFSNESYVEVFIFGRLLRMVITSLTTEEEKVERTGKSLLEIFG